MPKHLPLSLLSLSLAASLAVANEAAVEEIIVQGDFRPTDILNSPTSVSIFDSESAKQRAATHLEEMLNTLPNVNFAAGSNRARYIQIRGIGERSQFKEPINPSVGLMIDGVDMSGIGSMATLFDIEQVEVFRGPQGTQFGANALAGVINFQSVAPLTNAPSKLAIMAGNFGQYGIGFAHDIALDSAGHWGGRVAVQQQGSDGYYRNATLDRDDTNRRDELTARIKLRYQPDADSRLDMTVFGADIDNGYDAFTLDNSRVTLSDEPGQDTQQAMGASAVAATTLSSDVAFEATLALADSDSDYGYDEDWAFPTLANGTDFAGWEYSSFDNYIRHQQTQSADWRFLSTDEGALFDDTTDWVLGYYYLKRDQDLLRKYTYLASDFSSDYHTINRALYGQIDVRLNDEFIISAGVRRDSWTADYEDSNALVIGSDESLWGGKLALQWLASESSSLFASLSRGYKPGGVNTDGSLPLAERDFATETLDSFELGYKWRSGDGTMNIQSSLFSAERRDQQVKGAYVLPREDGSTEFVDYVENAASGSNRGVELEMQWQATEKFRLNGSVAWLDATFDEYLAPPTQADPEGLNLKGRQQAHAPEYQAFLQGEYTLSQRWALLASAEAKDGFYFSDRHSARANDYVLWNAQIIYRADDWTARLWGRNLGNEDVAVRGFGSFGNDPRDGYAVGTYVQYGEPRVVGLSIDWEW